MVLENEAQGNHRGYNNENECLQNEGSPAPERRYVIDYEATNLTIMRSKIQTPQLCSSLCITWSHMTYLCLAIYVLILFL